MSQVAQGLGLRAQLQRPTSQRHDGNRSTSKQRRVEQKQRHENQRSENEQTAIISATCAGSGDPVPEPNPGKNHAMGQLNNSSCISVGQRVGPISTRRVLIPWEPWRKPLPMEDHVGMCGEAAEGSNVFCMLRAGLDEC